MPILLEKTVGTATLSAAAARVATISGFLANPEYGGNAGTAGGRAIGFDDRFVWAEPFGWYDGEGAAAE
jgi:hypothetical protein